MKLPASLIIDDGCPVNPMYWHERFSEHTHIIPNEFTNAFGELCMKYGVKGKFSVMPMPAGLGRLDTKLSYVPQAHLKGFIKAVKTKIMPGFDITPELLTHQEAYDMESGRLMHVLEDEFVRKATAEQIADYIVLGLKILKNVGLDATGVTSPWSTGRPNEKAYAEGIARAFYRVYKRKVSWYFLHCFGGKEPRWPWISWQDKKSGLKCVSIAGLTGDAFWDTQNKKTKAEARRFALKNADTLLTEDGKKGRLRELFDGGYPLIIITHWQSLFSEGWAAGLEGLGETFRRMKKVFGDTIEWQNFTQLAQTALK